MRFLSRNRIVSVRAPFLNSLFSLPPISEFEEPSSRPGWRTDTTSTVSWSICSPSTSARDTLTPASGNGWSTSTGTLTAPTWDILTCSTTLLWPRMRAKRASASTWWRRCCSRADHLRTNPMMPRSEGTFRPLVVNLDYVFGICFRLFLIALLQNSLFICLKTQAIHPSCSTAFYNPVCKEEPGHLFVFFLEKDFAEMNLHLIEKDSNIHFPEKMRHCVTCEAIIWSNF